MRVPKPPFACLLACLFSVIPKSQLFQETSSHRNRAVYPRGCSIMKKPEQMLISMRSQTEHPKSLGVEYTELGQEETWGREQQTGSDVWWGGGVRHQHTVGREARQWHSRHPSGLWVASSTCPPPPQAFQGY